MSNTFSLEYRVYYDEFHHVVTYTTEKLPGNYLVISKEEYAEANPYKIIRNGKLVMPPRNKYISKFEPIEEKVQGTLVITTHPEDIHILVSSDEEHQYWIIQDREIQV